MGNPVTTVLPKEVCLCEVDFARWTSRTPWVERVKIENPQEGGAKKATNWDKLQTRPNGSVEYKGRPGGERTDESKPVGWEQDWRRIWKSRVKKARGGAL